MLKFSFDSLLCATLMLSAVTAAASGPPVQGAASAAIATVAAESANDRREDKTYLPALPYEITAMMPLGDDRRDSKAEQRVSMTIRSD